MKAVPVFTLIFACIILAAAYAQDDNKRESSLTASFRRISLEYYNQTVTNRGYYQDTPERELKAASSSKVKGMLDFVLEYRAPHIDWNNGLSMSYGRTAYYRDNATTRIYEGDDRILLSSDLFYKMASFAPFGEVPLDFGPFVSVEYETQFDDDPRKKVLRDKLGVRLFSAEYKSGLRAAFIGEYYMTGPEKPISSVAWEVGADGTANLRDNIKLFVSAYFKSYIYYSRYTMESFRYDLNIDTGLGIKIAGNLDILPELSYRYAHIRGAPAPGSNLTFGVSLKYAGDLEIW